MLIRAKGDETKQIGRADCRYAVCSTNGYECEIAKRLFSGYRRRSRQDILTAAAIVNAEAAVCIRYSKDNVGSQNVLSSLRISQLYS